MSEQFKSPLEEIIYLRRYLHINPELSFQEFNTQKFILNYVKDFKCEINVIKTGIMLYFDLKKEKIIGLRSEMDALPILEKTNVSYISKNKGVMHACGHDAHMALLLLVSKYINENYDKLNNNYLIVFQPSEEVSGGSKLIINSLFFNNHLPKYMISLHVYPTLKRNQIYYKSGSFLPMCTEIDIIVHGKSTHVSNLKNGIDANKIGVYIMKDLYNYFEKIPQTKFLIGVIEGGKQRNIVSDNLKIKITLRNFNYNQYLKQKKKIIDLVNKYNQDIDIKFNDEIIPLNNNVELIKLVKNKYKIYLTNKKMIGDDFSLYQTKCKIGYFLLGIKSSFLHENDFFINEEELIKGYDFLINILNI